MIRLLLARLALVALLGVAIIAAIGALKPAPLLVDRTTAAAAPIPDNALTCVVPEPDAGDGDSNADGAGNASDDHPAAPSPGSGIA